MIKYVIDLIIDFTPEARPISINQVTDAIAHFESSSYARSPEKLIMWEHQADWLVKQFGADHAAFDGVTANKVSAIFGIPVEYANGT